MHGFGFSIDIALKKMHMALTENNETFVMQHGSSEIL